MQPAVPVYYLYMISGHGYFGKVSLGYYQREAVAVKRFLNRDLDSWKHETRMFEVCMHHEAIFGFVASDIYFPGGESGTPMDPCTTTYGAGRKEGKEKGSSVPSSRLIS